MNEYVMYEDKCKQTILDAISLFCFPRCLAYVCYDNFQAKELVVNTDEHY